MFDNLYERVTDLPAIIQGALGSALFWLFLQAITFIGPRIVHSFGANINQTRKIREYTYRRLTGMSGLLNYTQGYLFTFSRVLQHVLMGFIFICIALLLGGSQPVIWGICLAGAIYFFLSGVVWLVPKEQWKADPPLRHWQRIAELEQELLGEVQQETKERIRQFEQEAETLANTPLQPTAEKRGG